ncbi:ABC transporter permease [Desulfurococcaceae archaeon AG1]|jgi:ABC-type dipeptide/oligopeptide/nickel transport system permease component|nr:ABC transporter permease [Desulfurococcaceae archaeon AG1]
MSLARYVGIRVAQAIPTLVGAMLVMFVLVRILPGDPARLIAGPEALEQDVQRIREQLGLNKPLYLQFVDYMSSILRGDFGTSIKYRTPVIDEIMARLPYTITLALAAEAIAVAIALPLGIYSAIKPRSKASYIASVLSLVGASTPIFWIGLIFIYVFAVSLRILPSSGADTPRHIILPAVTLALLLMGNLTRITRAAVMEALGSNHVLTAISKGLGSRVILVRHVLRNAMIPIITIMGIQVGALLGGAVITETVFAWPGIGSLLIDSLFYRDYPLAQGIILFIVFVFIVINIITDILYAYIDPRVREVLWRAGRS